MAEPSMRTGVTPATLAIQVLANGGQVCHLPAQHTIQGAATSEKGSRICALEPSVRLRRRYEQDVECLVDTQHIA